MKFRRFGFRLILFSFLLNACGENAGSDSANNTDMRKADSPVAVSTPETAGNKPEKNELDVPYVTTPDIIVDEMLKIAEVKETDVLYDLGSGDGRIPITAARRFGTRGVGIDLDPQRVKDANANAAKAKVTDKVKFIEGDLFEQDFSAATVIMLYLLPDINIKLRPKLLAMPPGTRIVSHNYGMGSWNPEVIKTIKTPDGETHYIYFWRVPDKDSAAMQ